MYYSWVSFELSTPGYPRCYRPNLGHIWCRQETKKFKILSEILEEERSSPMKLSMRSSPPSTKITPALLRKMRWSFSSSSWISTHGNQDGFRADLRSKSFSVGLRREEAILFGQIERNERHTKYWRKQRWYGWIGRRRLLQTNTPLKLLLFDYSL